MKHITIELTEEQHEKMVDYISRGNRINLEGETLSGYGIELNICELGHWLEIDFYGKLNIGPVNWKIE